MDHATVPVGPMGHATVIHNGCVVVAIMHIMLPVTVVALHVAFDSIADQM